MNFEEHLEFLLKKGYKPESAFYFAGVSMNEKTFSNYPKAIRSNAKRGIELNKKVNNKCATQVGKVRAQQLANGEAVTLSTVKRMYSYLSRAETYYDPNDSKACGTISYLLWGGKAALGWSRNILRQEGELKED